LSSAWAFAVAAWKRHAVESICLELQEIHGQCPALLLWRCWTLREKRTVGPEGLAKAVEVARNWEGEVLGPLRALRRQLTAPPSPGIVSVAGAARAAVRRRALEAELEAERALVDTLEDLETPGVAGGETSALEALSTLAEAWRPSPPSATVTVALARLARAL
jgi:uncharacterized protein (TIGR02444 family)